jgi:S-adenosylmethionine synthetase
MRLDSAPECAKETHHSIVYEFTSDHLRRAPDKVCDAIADGILDACLDAKAQPRLLRGSCARRRRRSRRGDIHCGPPDYEKITRRNDRRIGYMDAPSRFRPNPGRPFLLSGNRAKSPRR